MREIFPLLKECLELAQLDAGTKLQGKIVVDYTIAGEPSVGGIVEEAEINLERSDAIAQNPAFAQCVAETIYTMEFDAPRGGGITTISYPIEFTPDDEPPARDTATNPAP